VKKEADNGQETRTMSHSSVTLFLARATSVHLPNPLEAPRLSSSHPRYSLLSKKMKSNQSTSNP